MPHIVAIGPDCIARGRLSRRQPIAWKYEPHKGVVTLPDGNTVPVGVVSFAGSVGNKDGFFVMSLPSIWRSGGVTSELGLEALMDGVLLHEIMHTQQVVFVNQHMAALTSRYGFPESTNDDSLQHAFQENPEYVADYERERDLLFAAAGASTDKEARQLASNALSAMRARRARWFTGDKVQWAPLDDLFLQMEGLGQWLIWKHYVDGPKQTHSRDTALKAVRRGGKYWSQDEGLALMLVVDRLVPNWQRAAFAKQPALSEQLLQMAANR